jgi:TatD DNase family protein
MQLIDTHVHLNFATFAGDLKEIKARWQEAGVGHLIHSCVEPGEYPQIRALVDQIPELSFAIGLHPLDADRWTNDLRGQIWEIAQSDPRNVAIGELGLDFYKANNPDQQKEALIAQLEIAHQLNKPIIVHCREATLALREIFTDFWQNHAPLPGVMHCWSGSREETQWFLDLGLYISFSGVVTFKNAKKVQASAQMVPSDRLLIETDCPFLSPEPQRGKRNEPAYVRYVAEQVAQLRGVSLDVLAQQTTDNAAQLFRLPLAVAV